MPTETAKSASAQKAPRITSIDALRGFVMFTMIFVNDMAGVSRKIVPDWMAHFSDRHKEGSGMTFVDLVFPAFLFIVGMSIPFALGSRIAKGEPVWKVLGHVIIRTLALLAIGILMVNGESPAKESAGWSPELWGYTMFLSVIFAFCSISPRNAGASTAKFWKVFNLCVRVVGFAGMIYCAFSFHGRHDRPIITLSPLHIHASWYGILGLIGWAYLVAAAAFLVFRGHRTALLGCLALFLCFYPADQKGAFENFWLTHYVSFADTLGSHGAIATAGVLLASILLAPDLVTFRSRLRFTLLFSGGCAAAALLLGGLYGISKNEATPSWCLWSCAITALLWLIFYWIADVQHVGMVARPLAAAGQNVLLAYIFSEMLPNPLHIGGLAETGLAAAVACSVAWAAFLLFVTARLNYRGFRLKL